MNEIFSPYLSFHYAFCFHLIEETKYINSIIFVCVNVPYLLQYYFFIFLIVYLLFTLFICLFTYLSIHLYILCI